MLTRLRVVLPAVGHRWNSSQRSAAPPISGRDFRKFPLISKKPTRTRDAFVFTFATGGSVIPPGKHILARAPLGTDVVTQPYTPISRHDSPTLDLLVRLYTNGKMSGVLQKMNVGDELEILGPIGSWEYKPNMAEEVFLVAGGSGITPFYAILNYALNNAALSQDRSKFELLYANRKSENILLRDELDELERKFPDRFKVTYVVDELSPKDEGDSKIRPLKSWRSTMASFPGKKPTKPSLFLVCGPPIMETAVTQLWRESGISERTIRSFTKAGQAEPNPAPIIPVNKFFTMKEVEEHSHAEDAWIVIWDKVYDVTKFVSEHPGGDIILEGLGKDATYMFEKEFPHSDDAKRILASFQIGSLKK